MSRRLRQGIKDIEKDIASFERTVTQVQKHKPDRKKPGLHNVKSDRQLKPFVTEPVNQVVPRARQKKSKEKIESREIHKQVLENDNATVVITVRTKHSHVSSKRSNKVKLSPPRTKTDTHLTSRKDRNSSHAAVISKEATPVSKERKMKGLPWSCLLNNQQFEYETSSSVYSSFSQRNNIHFDRKSTTESKYIQKNNCCAFSQRHAHVDQSVQCTEPNCDSGPADPMGALKILFTDMLSTLQKSRTDENLERNLNKLHIDEEPVRLPRQNYAGFTPVHPEKASPADVISAPVPILPTCQRLQEASPSPDLMQKQLEITNLLLEQTYKELALKCEEYRKERDQLREQVIQQQKKVETLMEKEKDHLLVISSLQADVSTKAKELPHQTELPEQQRNAELEMELQLFKLQSEKYQLLIDSKEKEISRFREELKSIQGVISQQLENCKLLYHHKVSSEEPVEKPVCSSPTSSIVSLGTLESWQKISCICPSNDSDAGENTTVKPKQKDELHNSILEAIDTQSIQKLRKELSQVFEEIRHSRIPLPSPPRTYAELNDSQWTDLSVETLQNDTQV